MSILRRSLGIAAIVALSSAAHAQEGPSPRDPARARSDLLKAYAGNDDTEIGSRIEWAGKGHPEDAAYLLAMAKQTLADEQRGVWADGKYFTPYSAQEQRERMANYVGEAGGSDACLDLVLWFIDNDPDYENVTKVAAALERIPAMRQPERLAPLLDNPNDAVAEAAIRIAGANHLGALAGNVQMLSRSYRKALRQVAAVQNDALGFQVPAYKPEDAFTPWLENQLRQVRARVPVPIPKDAPWKLFTHTDPSLRINGAPQVTDFGGWLLDTTPDAYHLIDWAGVERTLPLKEVEMTDSTLAASAKILLAGQQTGAGAGSGGGRGARAGPPGDASSDASCMLGAWLDERGDKAMAAELLFPLLDAVNDQRIAFDRERDAVADLYRTQMLAAFGGERDYGEAAAIARFLASDAFKGWRGQAEAQELAAQLARRGDDFKTLKLPVVTAWDKQKATMTRAQQVDYLAARLRIITASDFGRGPAHYTEQQTVEPPARWAGRGANSVDDFAINPFTELKAMKLQVGEVMPLLPLLLDFDFMPMTALPPQFREGTQPLLRANQAAAELVNLAAGQNLVDLRPLDFLDDAGRRDWLSKIKVWLADHENMPRADMLLEDMQLTKSLTDFFSMAQELAVMKDDRATPLILKRFYDFGDHPQDDSSLAMLLYHLDPAASVTAARLWLREQDYHLRFWAAMILVHSGDKAKGEGWPELLAILKEHDDNQYVPHAFDELLASGRDDAMAFAVHELDNPAMMQWQGDAYRHRLAATGREEVMARLAADFDNAKPWRGATGDYQGKSVYRQLTAGDEVAEGVSRWRTDGYVYPELAPDDVRKEAREKLKKWLLEQMTQIAAGKPSEMKPATERLNSVQWNFPDK